MDAIYTCPEAARAHLESLLWPSGPVCPRCGGDEATKLQGKSTRPGVYKCRPCRKPFTVTVGTVFHASHVPLNKWLHAAHLMAASKKGISAHQIHRMLDVSYETAWFLCHRLREAMAVVDGRTLGGPGKVVEMDSAQLGKKTAKRPHVIAAQERGGKIAVRMSKNANLGDVGALATKAVVKGSEIHTDEGNAFRVVGIVGPHKRVNHSLAYVMNGVHTNSVEGFFSVLKRGLRGVYQHWSPDHTGRYVREFAFRHNTRTALGVGDAERAAALLSGAGGKRLTYERLVRASRVREALAFEKAQAESPRED